MAKTKTAKTKAKKVDDPPTGGVLPATHAGQAAFTMKAWALQAELSRFSSIVAAKHTIPITGFIHLRLSADGNAAATATNFDVTLRRTFHVESIGLPDESDVVTVLLPGKKLTDLVSQFDANADVSVMWVVKDGLKLSIESGSYRGVLLTSSVREFPELYEAPTTGVCAVDKVKARRALNQTGFAARIDDPRYNTRCVCVVLKDGVATFAATDSHRMAIASFAVTTADVRLDCFLAHQILGTMKTLLDEPGDVLTIAKDDYRTYWSVGESLAIVRNSDRNDFPNFTKILEALATPQSANIDRAELVKAVKRATTINETTDVGIQMAFTADEVTVIGRSSQIGSCDEPLACAYEGPDVSIKLNGQYLRQFLEACDDIDRVVVAFDPENTRMLWTPRGGATDYRYVLMPLA
jgi:DNA polymerase-3 subunit beta